MRPDTVFALKQCLVEIADVLAAAVARQQAPASDEMTMRAAQGTFGRTWLKQQIDRGRIEGRRRGEHRQSPILFSRTELMALKRAEEMVMQAAEDPANVERSLHLPPADSTNP